MLYSDFSIFTNDQEHLISSQDAFDYIEGLVIINRTDLVNSWRSTFNPKDPVQASQFISDGKTLFCLEMAKYYNPQEIDFMNQVRFTGPPISCFQYLYTILTLFHVYPDFQPIS